MRACACGAQHVWLGCSFQLFMQLSRVELSSAPAWHVAGARRAKGRGEAEQAAVRTGLATARQVRKRFAIWAPPCAGLGRSSNKCERVAGARRAKGHGAAAPTMHTCRLPSPPALQPHGKCENGLRSGSYVLAAARWPWQLV